MLEKDDMQLESQLLHSLALLQRRHMRTTWTLMSKSKFFALTAIKWAGGERNPFHGPLSDEDKKPAGRHQGEAEGAPEKHKLGGIPVSEIAAKMHASMPATSRTLGDLEREGLIERRSDVNDRRNTLVSLTPKGEHDYEEIHGKLMEYMALVVDDLGREQTERFVNDLDDASKAMEHALEVMRERYPEYEDVAFPRGPGFSCGGHHGQGDIRQHEHHHRPHRDGDTTSGAGE